MEPISDTTFCSQVHHCFVHITRTSEYETDVLSTLQYEGSCFNEVLKRTKNIRFVFAGSGDMYEAMVYLAAERGIADKFHFPGFQRGKQVYEAYKNSDVFVMPSVSEPFGIAPLEAMQCGTPSIISKQSGCGEILENVIKVDYWDINATRLLGND